MTETEYEESEGAPDENHGRRKLDTIVDFEEMLRRAARHGARDVLREIGLGDESAGVDIAELRDWLGNMRGVRRVFKDTTVKVFTGAFWIILAGGLIQYVREHMK